MSVFSLRLGRMLYSWLGLLMQVMSLVHGLSGLLLLRLRLLTLTSSVAVLFRAEVWFLGEGVLCSGLWSQGNASDVHDAAGVFLYWDSYLAPLLDMRRRFKAVMVVLGAMIQYGVSLGRLNPLLNGTGFWLLVLCLLLPLMISLRSGVWVSVIFIELLLIFIIVSGISGIGVGRTPWCIPIGGFVQNWFPQLHFSSVNLILRLAVLECLLVQPGLMRDSERPGFPIFCRSGQRDTSLEEFDREVDGWLPLLPEVDLPRLTNQVLAEVVHRKGCHCW